MSEREVQRFIDNKSLVALRKFAKAEAELKALKEKHDEIIEQVKDAMIANDVQKVSGDWGYITLAERTNYKATDLSKVSDEFKKQALDATKVKAQHTLTGELPTGIETSKTQYITKKLKDVE